MITSIVAAVIILGLLILVHEAGHFIVAKRCGVRVLRFSIGYPPKLFGIRRGETEYVIGAVPFGGYVRMLGDEIGDELSPGDVETYLTEIGRDLVMAESRSKTEPPAEQEQQMLLALAEKLGAGDGPDTAAQAMAALGRLVKAEETLLLDESSGADQCRKPPRRWPKVPLRHWSSGSGNAPSPASPSLSGSTVAAGPVANLVFAPLRPIGRFHVRRAPPVAGAGPGEGRTAAAAAGPEAGRRGGAVDRRRAV